MRKLLLLVGAGVGYVLGAKAGRERYEQITEQATKVWSDPRVQSKVEEVKSQAPQLADKVTGQARSAADKAKSKVGGRESTSFEGGQTSSFEGTYESQTGTFDSELGTTTVDGTSFGPGGERLP